MQNISLGLMLGLIAALVIGYQSENGKMQKALDTCHTEMQAFKEGVIYGRH